MTTWPGTSIPKSTRNAFDWLDQAALDFDARPRRVELVDARLIRDSGRRRATLGGDMAVVGEAA